MTALRAGSLCSGYGGLEMGAELVLGPLEHVWHGEYDPAPSAVLAARWPGTPNLGDIAAITAADAWAGVEPVDVLLAGYPCQGESDAGLRRGEDDPRFRWPDVFAAVRALRPRLVVLENVQGHLNRSFPRVVADLDSIGYVGRWRCVRASDAGAAHRRTRLFVVAWPAEAAAPWLRGADAPVPGGELTLLPTPMTADAERSSAAYARGNPTLLGALLPTPRARDGKGRDPNPKGVDLNEAVALLPTPRAQNGEARNQTIWRRPDDEPQNLENALALLPTPKASDTGTEGRRASEGFRPPLSEVVFRDIDTGRWGAYGPAITRWEAVIGRPAPDPTIPGRNRRQLSPLFVEWLMGLPAGHVTGVLVKRGEALRVLGNGVVPQAAALALRLLLTEPEPAAAEQLDLFALTGATS